MKMKSCNRSYATPAIAAVAILLGGAANATEIALWPEGMPEPRVPAEPAETVDEAGGITRRSNISNPRLVVYEPASAATAPRTAVIVVPGGGFSRLAEIGRAHV